MKKTFLASAAALALVLGACTPQQRQVAQDVAPVAATISDTVLPASTVASLKSTCQAASPGLAVATASTMPAAVSATAIDAKAFCDQLMTAPPGQVPATTNGNTLNWLPGVLSAVETAAKVAGVVVPLLL